MLKNIRRLLYAVLILVLAFYGWQLLSHQKEAQAAAKYKKDLYLSSFDQPQKAPDFTLVNESGKKVSLSDFKGKKVLLQFMDPKCTDICPLISQEIIQANNLLGSKAQDVVYVAVNVNEYHHQTKDVQAFSNEHGLSKLKNWYFLTGSPDQLKKVWKNYGIAVIPNKTGDVEHTSAVYFINPKGQEIYLGHPQNDKSSIEEWAKGISFFIQKMS